MNSLWWKKATSFPTRWIALETEAMNAVKGIYKDAKGDYTIKGEPNMERARELVFGPAYNAETEKIMAPLNEFFAALEKRTSAQVDSSVERVDRNGLFLCFALVLTLLLSLISAVYAPQGHLPATGAPFRFCPKSHGRRLRVAY